MILRPIKTAAGRDATINAKANGYDLTLTHMSLGDKPGALDPALSALRNERERVPCYGKRISPDQIHLDSLFDGPAEFWPREVGLWAGTVLVYYWSSDGKELGYKNPNADWLIGIDLTLDPNADGPINITAAAPNWTLTVMPHIATILMSLNDTNRLLLNQRFALDDVAKGVQELSKPVEDPHPQYTTEAKVNALIQAQIARSMPAQPCTALNLPVIDNPSGTMPVTATAGAGHGGTVSLAGGTAFTLGLEVVSMVSAYTQVCATAVWTSPALVVNAEYFLRAQFIDGVLTFYVQRGTLADAEPVSKKGTVNGASGGGFFSTTLDICLARLVTGAAGTAPVVQKVINRPTTTWSAHLNGNGTIYLPVDPFTRTGRITSSNPTPHATLITNIFHGSAGWTGASYWYAAPGPSATPTATSSLYWGGDKNAIIITSNNYVGDMTVSTCTGMFDHAGKKSMWQVFQSEHCLNDAAGVYGDENLLGMGTKNMLQADYDSGLAVSYTNCVNALLTWEVVR